MVQAMIYLYSLEPTGKRGPTLETSESEERLYQNLLGKILSIVLITGDIPAVGNDTSLIAQDQLLKSSQITLRGFSRLMQKLFIRVGSGRA